MELMMYLGNDLLESVPLNDSQLSQPGYLGAIKRQLKVKYCETLQQAPEPPEFLVVQMQPKKTA